MSSATIQSIIRRAIVELPLGLVYTMAAPTILKTGLRYHQEGGVLHMAWTDTALVVDVRNFEVKISVIDSRLDVYCNCAYWKSSQLCAHAVAVVFELKNLLLESNQKFSPDNKKFDTIFELDVTQSDTAGIKTRGRFAILITPNPDADFSLMIVRDGQELSYLNRQVPDDLRDIVQRLLTKRDTAAILAAYSRNAIRRYPLLMMINNVPQLIQCSTHPAVRSVTLKTSAKTVVLAIHAKVQGKPIDAIRIHRDLVLDSRSLTIHPFESQLSWSDIDRIIDGVPSATEIQKALPSRIQFAGNGSFLPVKQKIQLSSDAINRQQLCLSVDRPIPPSVVFHPKPDEPVESNVMMVASHRKNQVSLLSAYQVNNTVIPGSIRHLSSVIRCPKAIKLRLFMQILDQIAAQIMDPTFPLDPVYARYAHLIDHIKNALREPKRRLVTLGGKWIWVTFDLVPEFLGMMLAVRTWNLVGSGDFPVVLMPKEKFNQKLSAYFTALSAHNIPLMVNEKWVKLGNFSVKTQVQLGKLDFQCFASVSIFESGKNIESAHVETLDARSNWIETSTQIVLIPDEQYQAIQFVQDILKHKSEPIPKFQLMNLTRIRSADFEVSIPEKIQAVLSQLDDISKVPDIQPGPEFQGQLRHYQLEAVRWLKFLYDYEFGAILADEMGLGKTVQCIAFLSLLPPSRILIVVPPTLVFNWESEISKFLPGLKFKTYAGANRRWDHDAGVILTTYDVLKRDAYFMDMQWDVIIFDEAQLIKNPDSDRTMAASCVSGKFKIMITGTPIENHIGEFLSLINIALPGLLREGAYSSSEDLSPIVARTRPFLLRRTKAQVLANLPAKQEYVVTLGFSDFQRRQYRDILAQCQSLVSEAFSNHPAGQAQIIAITAILRLRQLCVSPKLLDPSADLGPKSTYLAETVGQLLAQGESILIFSQFVSFLRDLNTLFCELGYPTLHMDGKTAVQVRKERVHQFQSAESPTIFLISLKTGGVGLNLTNASTVFLVDPWWNPAVESQATDRVHRIGQQRSVSIHRLIMQESIEERMMVLKRAKQDLFRELVEAGSTAGVHQLSRSDFEFLITEG